MIVVSGSLNCDITLFVDKIVEPKTKVRRIQRFLGGSGGNIVTAVAKIVPGKAIFLGAVGSDDIGRAHLNFLKGLGVVTEFVKVVDGEVSGQAYAVVESSGRALIFSYSGANRYITKDLIDKLASSPYSVEYVIVSNPPLNLIEYLFKTFKARDAVTAWDPGAYAKLSLKEMEGVVRLTDYFLPNENELLMITGESDLLKAVKAVQSVNSDVVLIVKKGAEGTYLIRGTKVVHTSAVPLDKLGFKVVSTVGCGDVFTGVFFAFKYLGSDDTEAVKYATVAAAYKALSPDPRAAPTMSELLMFYDKVKDKVSQKVFKLSELSKGT